MRMIGNYLQIAVRILRRNKLLSIIEVCSLSLAFGFCILAYTLVSHEWSYDRFHENGAHLYRVVLNFKLPDRDRIKWGDDTPVAMAEAIQNAVPQVEETVRLVSGRDERLDLRRIRVWIGDTWNDETFLLVDENFFEVFTFPFEAGDPQTALQTKDGVVVSSAFARRYFGDEPAVGQTVRDRWDVAQTRAQGIHDPGSSCLATGQLVDSVEYPIALSQRGVPVALD